MQIEAYLENDDRAVIPLGCTEQHAYLSLATDSILAERISLEAAVPLGIPVFPVVAYGITPSFRAYPGTVSLRTATYGALLKDIYESLVEVGFKRILFVNGHGGNAPGQAQLEEIVRPGTMVSWHNWWIAPRTWARVQAVKSGGSHANWMENFPWTRLAEITFPESPKPPVDFAAIRGQSPGQVREILGDGSFGDAYEVTDDEMLSIWSTAVDETRDRIASL